MGVNGVNSIFFQTKKPLEIKRLSDVDPAGLTHASYRAILPSTYYNSKPKNLVQQ